jgi:Fe2+ or Zn2+ uptake regulation protein
VAYSTRQRTALWNVLEETDRPLTPHEIQNAAKSLVPSLGMATEYRAVYDIHNGAIRKARRRTGDDLIRFRQPFGDFQF